MPTPRQRLYLSVLDTLLNSAEPSVRWKVRSGILKEDPRSKSMRALREDIRNSARVKALLAHRDGKGRLVSGRGVYDKWQGAHWILAALADLGYPEGDKALAPVREQILDCWLDRQFYTEFEVARKANAYKKRGVPVMQGRHRRCASQQGYALYFLLKLGLESERVHALVERLLHWRWPDGGWNCDKERRRRHSSTPFTACVGFISTGRASASERRSTRPRRHPKSFCPAVSTSASRTAP
jgi:hypothetical protein